jgi:hypothetical protein
MPPSKKLLLASLQKQKILIKYYCVFCVFTAFPLMPIVFATPEVTMTTFPLNHFRAALRADCGVFQGS